MGRTNKVFLKFFQIKNRVGSQFKMAKKKGSRSDHGEEGKNVETSRLKYLAFALLFIFPAFSYILDAAATISKYLRLASSSSIYVFIALTAGVAVVVWFYFRTSLKKFYKYFLLILLPFLLFPSLQVYTCSPVVLDNKDFGTRFKLGTTAEEILRDCGGYCLRHFSKSLYSLSFVTPRITLQVMHGAVVDLNITTNSIMGSELLKTSRIFLIFSLRSVKGKVHSLSVITKVPFRSTKIIKALGEKKSIELTGRIINIGADLKEMKSNLERNKLFIRPVVFEPYHFEVKDDDEL